MRQSVVIGLFLGTINANSVSCPDFMFGNIGEMTKLDDCTS